MQWRSTIKHIKAEKEKEPRAQLGIHDFVYGKDEDHVLTKGFVQENILTKLLTEENTLIQNNAVHVNRLSNVSEEKNDQPYPLSNANKKPMALKTPCQCIRNLPINKLNFDDLSYAGDAQYDVNCELLHMSQYDITADDMSPLRFYCGDDWRARSK